MRKVVVVLGGMQDYNYVWAQCLELTLEISCCKFPPETQLPALWEANRGALLAFMQQVHLGRVYVNVLLTACRLAWFVNVGNSAKRKCQ